MSTLLAAETFMGAVTLNVAELDGMTAYYRDAITLDVMFEGLDTVVLGRGNRAAVVLKHSPGLKHAGPRDAGLFHTAIVYDTQQALATAVYRVATAHPASFTGSSDHLVSKAFYFNDPEGNGVELYWDRDRTEWSWTHGSIEMSTLYLDPNEFLREFLPEEGLIGEAHVGHVHLSVGDTASAKEFYVDRLGFEKTVEFPGQAVFVSAGGYHHHMAMNVWNSAGAGRRARTLGLGQVDIVVPNADELGALEERMKHFGVDSRNDGRSLTLEDPWANEIRVEVGTSSTASAV